MSDAEWFDAWAIDHARRMKGGIYPRNPDTEDWIVFWDGWRALFATLAIERIEAEAASIRLQIEPPRFPGEHLREFRRHVEAIRAEAVASRVAAPSADTLDGARKLSWGCPECGGPGLTGRYVWEPTRRDWYSVGFACRCPAGQWFAKHYDHATDATVRGRLPNLQAHPELWDRGADWHRWPADPAPTNRPRFLGAKFWSQLADLPAPALDRDGLNECPF